jgi:hypothetical protein
MLEFALMRMKKEEERGRKREGEGGREGENEKERMRTGWEKSRKMPNNTKTEQRHTQREHRAETDRPRSTVGRYKRLHACVSQ